jgi:hypothetical protein
MTEPVDKLPTSDAERVWAVLAPHRGEAKALKAREIAALTGIGDEAGTEVREIVSDALEFFPEPVGAHPGMGIFVITTGEEGDSVRADLKSRLEKLARRIAILDRKMAASLGLSWDALAGKYVRRKQLF